jgi:hypothetical protein
VQTPQGILERLRLLLGQYSISNSTFTTVVLARRTNLAHNRKFTTFVNARPDTLKTFHIILRFLEAPAGVHLALLRLEELRRTRMREVSPLGPRPVSGRARGYDTHWYPGQKEYLEELFGLDEEIDPAKAAIATQHLNIPMFRVENWFNYSWNHRYLQVLVNAAPEPNLGVPVPPVPDPPVADDAQAILDNY